MEDLAQWLRAQLDEDERIARAVEDRSAPWDGQWMADGDSAVRTVNGHVLFYRHDSGPLKPGLTDHVAEWDPARVLRDIAAKRRIVQHLAEAIEASENYKGPDYYEGVAACELTLKLLASVYADSPGYQESWRP
ncbi:DUF6221 family protein [Streptomyces sp. NPDC093591]|uniref:DUF6221 family protein n=1 Tax=Streptomyces sp. NPDC093591 TaxID=3366044 RepID=UPI0038289783